MAGDSLVEIVEKMKAASITRHWGAICGFGRTELNRVLRQQWLEKYQGAQYVPKFSGQMDLNNAKTEYGKLKDIVLGDPLLSFQNSTMLNSKATLTLSFLGGHFSAYDDTYGLLYEFEITEDLGYTLVVELDLNMVTGSVDHRGRVTLDLSKGTKFTCNLAAPTESQIKIGEWFDRSFKALDPEQQVFVLGMLDLNGDSDLIPKSFRVLTQPAPGSKVKGAPNAGDGAVLVMVQLRGDAEPGTIPGSTFPWLFPSDGDYSAFMLLAEKYAASSDPEKEEWIQTLLFPGQQNIFVESSRHTPRDMVIFGRLAPSQTSLTIEPDFHVMKAGGAPFEYKAYLNGVRTNVTWSVESLNTLTSAGDLDKASGVYQPVSADKISSELVRNIITASLEDPETKIQHKVSALLLVSTRAMAISPGTVSRIEGQTKKATFVVSALSGSKLTWKPPLYGRLVATGNTAEYTPPPASKRRKLPAFAVEDEIVVTDETGESVKATVVLTRSASTLMIDPPFVNGLTRSETVTFTAPLRGLNLEEKWSVIGEGSIEGGIYTVSPTNTRDHDIVVCEVSYMGTVLYAGFSTVRLSSHVKEAGWKTITTFKLKALSPARAFANGLQRIHLEAYIETDGDNLLKEERDGLRIYYDQSNQHVTYLSDDQEGIALLDPSKPTSEWAQTQKVNGRFKYYPGAPGSGKKETGNRAKFPDRVDVYMVNRAPKATVFYAVVLDKNNVPIYSKEISKDDGVITLYPEAVPTPDLNDYTFERTREEGGGGGNPQDPDYDFDYYQDTTDYWSFRYERENQKGLNFQMARVTGTRSLVQWESDADNERVFSYTGFAYNNPLIKGDEKYMEFSSTLHTHMPKGMLNSVMTRNLAEGDFKVGLFRVGHLKGIRQDSSPSLRSLKGKVMTVHLIDNEGNPHYLDFGFVEGDRNRLKFDRSGGGNLHKLSGTDVSNDKKTSGKKPKSKAKAKTKA